MEQNNKRKEIIRAVKFGLFSVSAGIIEIAVYTLLDKFTDWPYWPCYLIALICSVVWNFTLNRQFTFQSANNVPIAMMKVLAFYAVFTPVSTIAGNYLAYWSQVSTWLLTSFWNSCMTDSLCSGAASIPTRGPKTRKIEIIIHRWYNEASFLLRCF